MLFNSYPFLFGFLPSVLFGFFFLARWSRQGACLWLGLSSLFFYGWWSPKHLPLLLASIAFSFWISRGLVDKSHSPARRRSILIFGVTAHLVTLAFFKYGSFLAENLGISASFLAVDLPIGISFYTFTQIAFLVDAYQGKVTERRWDHYLLFVTYFPHLIAGPVLHHAQMMPQFANAQVYRLDWDKIRRGLTIFILGLSKKLLVADPLADYANVLFNTPLDAPMMAISWFGVLAYAFQIYFDFSGYSDMAIGLSLLFGIKLPVNFNSPYKAANIVDFWRRWHISLSIFLRDYLYIPLGGNRHGAGRRYANLLITMLLGGLWHGASWTFVLWGGLHGFYLGLNHAWRKIFPHRMTGWLPRLVATALTFVAVCWAWVLFRSDNLDQALRIYQGLLGLNGLSLPSWSAGLVPSGFLDGKIVFQGFWQNVPTQGESAFFVLLALAAFLAFVPRNLNRLSLMDVPYQPRALYGLGLGALLGLCLACLAKTGPSEFLYFRF